MKRLELLVESVILASRWLLVIFYLGRGCPHCIEQLNTFAPVQQKYASAGIDLLINQKKLVTIGGTTLALSGLDDMLNGQPDLAAARAELTGDAVEIWVVHEPSFADQLPATLSGKAAMLLAGHTHGGQIRIPLLPPVKPVGAGRFLEGWYRDTAVPLYVSRGVGTTGIPARFRCAAELPIFTLKRA